MVSLILMFLYVLLFPTYVCLNSPLWATHLDSFLPARLVIRFLFCGFVRRTEVFGIEGVRFKYVDAQGVKAGSCCSGPESYRSFVLCFRGRAHLDTM